MILAEIDGERLTPPVSCGLLPGTCRAALMARGTIRESVLTKADLGRASGLWLINAVHGMRAAEVVS